MLMIFTNLQALVVIEVCIGLALVLKGVQVRLQRVRLQQLCKQVAICKVLNMQKVSPAVLEAPLLKPVLVMLLGTACLAPHLLQVVALDAHIRQPLHQHIHGL
jgi:hypothetical protein